MALAVAVVAAVTFQQVNSAENEAEFEFSRQNLSSVSSVPINAKMAEK